MFATGITFENIVEKTKRMLGKNYRGDKEVVPVYSAFSPILCVSDYYAVLK